MLLKNKTLRLILEKNYKDLCINMLKENKLTISLAESCTGGMIASDITDIAGVSEIFKVSFIVYSNEAKINILAVNPHVLVINGAVSSETVGEMLEGVVAESKADIVGAVSGVAGPDGGSVKNPVGTVYIGCGDKYNNQLIRRFNFDGNRKAVRRASVDSFFKMLYEFLTSRDSDK